MIDRNVYEMCVKCVCIAESIGNEWKLREDAGDIIVLRSSEMLTYLKRSKEKIGFIVVYSVDRFSKFGANAIYIASELKKEAISVLAVTQPTNTNTPSGSLQ